MAVFGVFDDIVFSVFDDCVDVFDDHVWCV